MRSHFTCLRLQVYWVAQCLGRAVRMGQLTQGTFDRSKASGGGELGSRRPSAGLLEGEGIMVFCGVDCMWWTWWCTAGGGKPGVFISRNATEAIVCGIGGDAELGRGRLCAARVTSRLKKSVAIQDSKCPET